MKVIIYGRVSTHSQDVDRQIEELVKYAKSKQYEVVEVFTETISGVKNRKERKEISRLIEYVNDHDEVKGVLVWELSRIGRNTLDVLDIINSLTEKKIWVYTKKENIYTLKEDLTESTNSKLLLTILSGVATLERETILSRSISGLRKSVSDGNWVGGVYSPYGYKKENKKIVIDDEESKIIKRIFQLYLEGNGTKRLCNILNKEKVPTRYNKAVKGTVKINEIDKKGEEFTWKEGTMYSLLTNPVYIGKKVGKGTLEGIKLNSPSIIDEETFQQVQEKLKNTVKQHSTKFFYLFEGKLKCGICGRTYFPHKRLSNTDNRYCCLSKRYNEVCENFGISIPKLNDGVWSLLRNNKKELKNIINLNSNKEKIEEELKNLNEIKSSTQVSLDNLQRREGQILDLLLDDKIDKDLYTSRFNEITIQKEKLNKEFSEINNEIRVKKKYQEKQNDFNSQLKGIKDDKRTLKRTINNVVDKIVINPIFNHQIKFQTNKQDKFVFIEVFTYLNDKTPLCFIISQRSQLIISAIPEDYDKETKTMINNELKARKLFHLRSLD
jgi:site-specific DNA recombinase